MLFLNCLFPGLPKKQCHLSFISVFTTYIKHLSGKINVVADCLSRSPINNISLGIDYTAMAQGQHTSLELQAYPTTITARPTCPFIHLALYYYVTYQPVTHAPLYLRNFVVMCLNHYTIPTQVKWCATHRTQ